MPEIKNVWAAHRYVEEIGPAGMLATKRFAGVIPDVDLETCNMYASNKHE